MVAIILAAQIIFLKGRSETEQLLFRILPSGRRNRLYTVLTFEASQPQVPSGTFFYKSVYLYVFIWLHRVLNCASGGSSSLTGNRTWAPCLGSAESWPLDYQEASLSLLAGSPPGCDCTRCGAQPHWSPWPPPQPAGPRRAGR